MTARLFLRVVDDLPSGLVILIEKTPVSSMHVPVTGSLVGSMATQNEPVGHVSFRMDMGGGTMHDAPGFTSKLICDSLIQCTRLASGCAGSSVIVIDLGA